MKIEYELAEKLVDAAIKNIDSKKNNLAIESLNKALRLYNEFILSEVNLDEIATLYYQRSKIHKNLGVGYNSNYYLDIKFASDLGQKEALKIFKSKSFKDEYFEQKITFVFEISEKNNEIELSSLFLKGYNHWIDKLKIISYSSIETNSLTNFNISRDDENYKKMILRLIFGITFSDEFVCNDLNKTKYLVNKFFNNQKIEDILKLPKGYSLITEIEKYKSYKTKNKDCSDSFNILFNKNIENPNDSEINLNMVTESYGFLKFVNSYSSIAKNNQTIINFLNINN